ncbi:MAG: aminoacylase [Verrucomicrobia bacterium]|nr:MAG: aminoacylase [Verrucomicrobia bacterium 13_2_20CM_2_54_15_9cls]PYI44067.1 MAG: aminoacylase [Verrucomicrobiota bacterium]
MKQNFLWAVAFLTIVLAMLAQERSQSPAPADFDVIIRGGTVYDGTGAAPRQADVAIRGDRIAAIGDLNTARARTIVDAKGLAVAPGFINMLSWSTESLIQDGRSQSEIRQGVTTEIMGEGESMGPVNDRVREHMLRAQTDIKYDIKWNTLAEYLQYLEKRGISCNVASFLGATTVREYVIGFEDKAPTPEQLDQMRELVRKEMEAGALGIGTSLIYPPAFYASTDELIELCKVAAKYQGKYISHMRSEGNQLIEALDELLRIAREANIPAELYHIKAAGQENWSKEDELLPRIERAQKEGLNVRANMYTYTAAGTGLDACLPPWSEDGGYPALFKRLRDPATREKIKAEVKIDSDKWENLYLAAGSPDKILLVGFKSDKLKPLTGKTLAEVAKMRGKDPIDTMMDLIAEDESRIGTIYFVMSEDNVKKEVAKAWISFGSDEASQAPEPPFTKSNPHPRAYGNFARVLGKYVRDEKVIPMKEAIHRLSGLPATNLGLDHRGFVKEGMFADVVVFDPATITDRATFEKPHQYAVGVKHVFVNGVQVIKDGEHTGAKPGRALWGQGKVK